MKAISLWQPWASAVAFGSKWNETRHWSTTYRGPLAIHAAKRWVKSEIADMVADLRWRGAMHAAELIEDKRLGPLWSLPLGEVVAVVDLVAVIPVDRLSAAGVPIDFKRRAPKEASDLCDWTERDMGNYDAGRFAWVFRKVRPLANPIPYAGAQGFFDVPDALIPDNLMELSR